jgi:hypothetical protein
MQGKTQVNQGKDQTPSFSTALLKEFKQSKTEFGFVSVASDRRGQPQESAMTKVAHRRQGDICQSRQKATKRL